MAVVAIAPSLAPDQTADVSSASRVERVAPGQYGNPHAGGQSLFNGLEGQASYRRVPAPVRPVRHRQLSSVQSSGRDEAFATIVVVVCRSLAVKGCWRVQTAQMILASLFATATAATLCPRRW